RRELCDRGSEGHVWRSRDAAYLSAGDDGSALNTQVRQCDRCDKCEGASESARVRGASEPSHNRTTGRTAAPSHFRTLAPDRAYFVPATGGIGSGTWF